MNKLFLLMVRRLSLIKKSWSMGAFVLLCCIGSLFFLQLFAQSAADLRLEKAALEERLAFLKKEMKAEETSIENFKAQKENLLKQKKQEEKVVRSEIRNRELEIANTRREVAAIEQLKRQIEQENKEIANFFLNYSEKLLLDIENGIPFEKTNRKATLANLIYDLKGDRITASEAFNRFITFIDNEIAMGYDSQVVRAIVNVGDKKLSGTLLRLGRIYFAFDAGDEVYRFYPNSDGEGYFISEETLPLAEQKSVREIIDMIEGRNPPDLVSLTIPVKQKGNPKVNR